MEGLTSALRSALANRFGNNEPFEIMLGGVASQRQQQPAIPHRGSIPRRAGFSVLGVAE